MTRPEPTSVQRSDVGPESGSDSGAESPWWQRRPGLVVMVGTLVVAMPMFVALVSLRRTTWHPVLDLAMTELRVRDVGTSHTPLIGLPGRIGTYPHQGSHPGPLSFYLLAPVYRLLGSSSFGLQAGTVLIHVGAIATALWIGVRRGGWRGVAVVGLLLAIVVRGYGQVVLTQPWNPYLPVVAWIVVLLAAWAVLSGDDLMLIPLVVAAIFCAQTHVPYLLLGVGMVALGLGAVILRIARSPGDERGRLIRVAAWAVGLGAVLWLPPVADQLTNSPGNIRQLVRHFGSPPEKAIGLRDGIELALRRLDVRSGPKGQLVDSGGFLASTSTTRGALVLAAWVVSAVVAWRIGSRSLKALHLVVGVALLLGLASMARIFGRPWFYLTLWAWGVAWLVVGAILWTAVTWWGTRRSEAARDVGTGAAIAAGVLAVAISLVSAVDFADAHPPEERLSESIGTLSGPTYQAVVDGVGAATGADGKYLVRWSDAADIGSPGFGLLNELERRGLDVAADDYFDVQVTKHRVRPRSEADAQIHLATGGYIDVWRQVPGAVEVASFDRRTPAERTEYAQLRTRLIDRLTAENLPELVPLVDTNLFGISVDTRLSAADQADLGRMVDLGQQMVVFIAPPPADGDPNAL